MIQIPAGLSKNFTTAQESEREILQGGRQHLVSSGDFRSGMLAALNLVQDDYVPDLCN